MAARSHIDKTVGKASSDAPPFTVRRSARARQARLRVTPRDGVVLVLPEGLDCDPERIIEERRDWIDDALREQRAQRAIWLADPKALLPDEIAFTLTGEVWAVGYERRDSATVRCRTTGSAVTVAGQVDDAARCLQALHRWLQARARERLLPRAASLAERFAATPTQISVRGQRERWGGCSKSGHITLNRSLLFLHPELVDAVIAHELAHLAHPDHSRAFWAELERLDPAVAVHRAELVAVRDAVPPWAERRS